MPPQPPYDVLFQERVRIGPEDWDFVVVGGVRRAVAAVYHHWSRRFLFCFGLPPLADQPGGRLGWSRNVVSFIEKSRPRPGAAAPATQAVCPWLARSAPAVHEYLTVTALPGGELRQTSTLTVFVEDGVWKCCLSERDAECNLFASGECLESLFEALEERLTAPVVDWRRKGGKGNGKSHKGR